MQRWVQQSHLRFEIRDLEKIKNTKNTRDLAKNTRLAFPRFGDSLEVARSKVCFEEGQESGGKHRVITSTSTFSHLVGTEPIFSWGRGFYMILYRYNNKFL